MDARSYLVWGTLVAGVIGGGAVSYGGTPCPSGRFVVTQIEGPMPFSELRIDPAGGQVAGNEAVTSRVRVRAGTGATRVRAWWGGLGSPRALALSVRIDGPTCDALVGRVKYDRRVLRRALGGRPLPPGIVTRATFAGERSDEVVPPPTPSCANEQGGPAVATLAVATGGGDTDLGWTGVFHNVAAFGGGRFTFCLDECGASGDSECRATAASEIPYGPPTPMLAAGIPLCLTPTVYGSTQAGRIDLGSGAVTVPIRVGVGVHLTSTAALCPRCEGGRCAGGSAPDAACAVDAEVPVRTANGQVDVYRLSRDCLPSQQTLVGEVPVDLSLTTGTASLDGSPPCFASNEPPPPDDACGEAGCAAECSDIAGGLAEVCCLDDPARPCFPTRDGGAIARTGLATAPRAADGAPWPQAGYPKEAEEVVAAVTCVGSTGSTTVDSAAGLPGPLALRIPVRLTIDETDGSPSGAFLSSAGRARSLPEVFAQAAP